jgi:CheY-like chemotaxis protein
MMMPDLDGLGLAREIRRHRDEHELPLVLLTSLGRLPEADLSRAFTSQLTKPIRASQLYNALLKALAERPRDEQAESAAEESKPIQSSLRILLAEDNAVNQKVALKLLDQLGYRADVVSNGLEALDALDRQRYDVVLMDVQMPELDGLDATRRIRLRWSAEARPYVVAMTANAMPEDREACRAAGMDDYVAKPIRPEELAAALSRVQARHADSNGAVGDGVSLEAGVVDDLRELGGEEFLAEIIDTFLDEAPSLIGALRASHERGEAEELRRAAHSLKSNGETFGAKEFAGLCRELEEQAKQGEFDRAAELVDRIERAYRALAATLAALRPPVAS